MLLLSSAVKAWPYPGVAQLVARLTGGQEAAGSNPVAPTTAKKTEINRLFLFFVAIAF